MQFRHAATLTAIAMLAVAAQPVLSQSYPSRSVRVIVGLAPGGGTDIQARLFSTKLTEELKQSFVVENRPGAGLGVAIQALNSSPPDGYTILAVTPTLTLAPAFGASYDPVKDFAHVSLVTKAPYLMVVNPSVPAKSFAEFVAFAKSNAGKVNFGSGGLGTTIHLGGLWIGNATNTVITVIPYKGTGPSLTALLANETHATFGNPISTLKLVQAGKLRALGVTSANRSKAFPDIPTIAESGIPGYDVTTWHGWAAPRGTPRDTVTRLSGALSRMINAPDMSAKMLADGADPVGSTPEQFVQLIASETPRWRKLVQDTGAKME